MQETLGYLFLAFASLGILYIFFKLLANAVKAIASNDD